MENEKALISPKLSEEEIEKFKGEWEKVLASGEPPKIIIAE